MQIDDSAAGNSITHSAQSRRLQDNHITPDDQEASRQDPILQAIGRQEQESDEQAQQDKSVDGINDHPPDDSDIVIGRVVDAAAE